MSSRPELHIAPCSYKAAKFAVERWHYSGSMPAGKRVAFGVWEGGDFRGAIVFARGANSRIASPYDLQQSEVCELVRIALRSHEWPVTRMVSVCLRLLKQTQDIRLIISYADPAQGHHGGIYQGGNWIYAGKSIPQNGMLINGKEVHKRTCSKRWGTASVPKLRKMGIDAHYGTKRYKLKYLYPLDDEMRTQIKPLAKPYPKPEDLPAQEAS